MRSCKAGHLPHFSSPELTISFKHEADCAGNKSVTEIYTLTAEDLAVMVETDRRERAALSGKPIDTVQPRHPQVILNDLWRGEEANAHETHRGDRGKGKSRCTCGAGCGPRRGCRLPSTHPWSLDQMLEIDRDPTASERTPEDAVIADEEAQTHASDLAVMREAVARLSDRHQMIVDLMIDQEHRFDYDTPIEETLEALHQLVESGLVRAIGASEMYAYQFHHMIHTCERNGWTPFSTMQCHYSLLYREDERELLPLCDDYGILPTPYSPLASGHLTRPQWDSDSVRSARDETMKNKYDAAKALDLPVIERVKILADRYGVPMSQVALAWQWTHRQATPIVGCSKPERVNQAVAALNLSLSSADVAYLEEPYQAHNVVGPASRPGEGPNPGSHRNTDTK